VNKTFPTGIQNGIEFSNEFKQIHYELEGEPCETWGKEEGSEAVNGTYTGRSRSSSQPATSNSSRALAPKT